MERTGDFRRQFAHNERIGFPVLSPDRILGGRGLLACQETKSPLPPDGGHGSQYGGTTWPARSLQP